MSLRRVTVVWLWLLFSGAAHAQHAQMTPGMSHEEHLRQMQKDADLKRRGGGAMGFDQDKTTHHFRLTPTGGSIAVAANSDADEVSRTQIREHLRAIAGQFADGVFDAPFATHGDVPPGVVAMTRLKAAITFSYEDAADGGVVRIETSDCDATRAVHDFLRYQITEHRTGDPLTVQP